MSLLSAAHGLLSTIFSNLFISLPYPDADLQQQTVIVTGANTGLGLEASRHLVRLGVDKLIMGVRNLEKGESAKEDILTTTKRDASCIEVWPIDMDSYDSVKKFASRVSNLPRLDAVLANAGIYTTVFNVTEDNEKTITTNVISTFLLCMSVLPKLHQSAEQFNIVPRLVITNSALHYVARLNELDVNDGEILETLKNEKTAFMTGRYPLSKLLVLYAVRELAGQLMLSQKPLVIINTPNPSFCKSGLLDHSPSFEMRMAKLLLPARSTDMGSRALVHAILSGVESHGQYLTNCHVQAPSFIVTNEKGTRLQKAFFVELVEKLEEIVPGIMSGL